MSARRLGRRHLTAEEVCRNISKDKVIRRACVYGAKVQAETRNLKASKVICKNWMPGDRTAAACSAGAQFAFDRASGGKRPHRVEGQRR